MPQKESHKGAALAFFMRKYAPEATEGVFKIVATAYLRSHGYSDVDLGNLSLEQGGLLLEVFERLTKENMEEWISGLLLRDSRDRATEEMKRRVEAARVRRAGGN